VTLRVRDVKLVRFVTVALAALHVLPARHHLGDLASSFSMGDAWKGIGAAVAVVFLLLDGRTQARVVAALTRRDLLATATIALAIAHLVPAFDHVPKLFAAASFADGWRAIGSTIAVAWFASPRQLQFAAMRRLNVLRVARA